MPIIVARKFTSRPFSSVCTPVTQLEINTNIRMGKNAIFVNTNSTGSLSPWNLDRPFRVFKINLQKIGL